MKTVLILIFILMSLYSCDTRKDVYKDGNVPPSVKVKLTNPHSAFSAVENGSTITDTLKQLSDYNFQLSIEDENIVNLEFSGNGTLKLSGVEIQQTTVNPGTLSFKWEADTLGLREFKIKTTDQYGLIVEKTFKIFVFYNYTPVVSWTLIHVGNLDPLEKKIIVSGQDGDQLYGGNILYYQYVIGADTTNYPFNELNYVFPAPGQYSISVRAFDNNNEWGIPMTISNYTIN